jgi:16S rRNA processing protein RimM
LTESIELGRVSRAHGLRGELEVRLYWPESTALLEAERIVLSAPKTDGSGAIESRVCRVRHARATPKGVLLTLHEVADRNAAELLRGWSVSLDRGEMPPLEDGEYYLCDTVGADVVGPDGAHLGRVLDLRLYPSVDALLIELDSGAHVEQPLVDHWVELVDVAGHKIVLSSTEGMLDVSDEKRPTEATEGGAEGSATTEAAATSYAARRAKKAARTKRPE